MRRREATVAFVSIFLPCNKVSLDELWYVAVGVFNDLIDPVVDFFRVIPFVDDQSVKFVEHQAGFDLGFPRLPNDGGCLRTDTLDHVDHHQSTIWKTDSRADLNGEIDVARRIDEINQVVLVRGLPSFDRRGLLLSVDHGDWGSFHGDLPELFIFSAVEVAQLASHPLRDDIVGCDQAVAQSGLAVVDVGQNANVTDVLRNLLQFVHFFKPGKSFFLRLMLTLFLTSLVACLIATLCSSVYLLLYCHNLLFYHVCQA